MAVTPLAFAQSARRSDNPHHVAASAPSDVVPVNYAVRGFQVYTNETQFNTDHPGLPTETFVEAAPEPACAAFDGPLDNATSAPPWFAPGDILPGVTFTTDPVQSPDLFIADPGCFDATSYLIGNNYNTSDFALEFSPAVDAVGFDVDLDNLGTTTTIVALDASGNMLGSTTISGGDIQFRGFAGTRIARVVIQSAASVEWVEVDDVRFGGGGEPPIFWATANPPTLPGSGGTVTITVTVYNMTLYSPTLDLWLEADGPDSFTYTRFLGRGTLPAGQTVTRSYPLRVPASAPNGKYVVRHYLGNFPGTAYASSTPVTISKGPSPPTDTAAGVEHIPATPSSEGLARTASPWSAVSAYPNPFVGRTVLSFAVAGAADVRLAVYDVLGREVAVLVDGYAEAGWHRATFDAHGLAAGTYVYRLVLGGEVHTGQLTVVY